MNELGYPQTEPTLIYSDNMSVIQTSETLNKDNRSIYYLINKINFDPRANFGEESPATIY